MESDRRACSHPVTVRAASRCARGLDRCTGGTVGGMCAAADEWGPCTDPVDMRSWDPALDAEDDGPDPDPRTLADQVDVEARHYRTLGTDFGVGYG